MRNPKPICSCPHPGRIHGSRRNRKLEQVGEIRTSHWRPTAAKEKSPTGEKKTPAPLRRLLSRATLPRRTCWCVSTPHSSGQQRDKKPPKALDTWQHFHT